MARQKRQFMRQGVADLPDRATVNAYAGASGEPIFDGDTLRIMNGTTPGGILLARSGRKPVADANYGAQVADVYVGISALTVGRTVTLPAASAYPPGQTLFVADETGLCSPTLPITVAAAGSDTIAGQASITMGSPYQKLAFHSNGSNLWTFA
ncbi:hypothetical protein [Methylobacterium trifolii]|uniref:Major tropism determinant N-terminal domain-containing protein n=1 Tax=Methylobacterium trifolii TaxID=1003092 RepID=A0ABQ4U2M2_9HYPH|nr:hypothetical protein [Methylobacterium trifolii]GJE61696.1 hypothetical protein MPOCJGCO_3819 [Methylobacterium trifolii]